LQGTDGVGGDHRRQELNANAQPDLGEEAVDPDLLDEAVETIAGAEAAGLEVQLLNIIAASFPAMERMPPDIIVASSEGGA
jgi:hypothetical protein